MAKLRSIADQTEDLYLIEDMIDEFNLPTTLEHISKTPGVFLALFQANLLLFERILIDYQDLENRVRKTQSDLEKFLKNTTTQ